MKTNFIVIPFLVLLLQSCGNQSDNIDNNNPDAAAVDSSSIDVSDTSMVNLPKIFNNVDTNEIIKVLKTGTYHNDEVWANVEDGTWFGLFQNKAGFVIEKIEIVAENVNDGILDADTTIKTGWEISTKNVNTNLLLMQGIELKEGLLKHVHISNSELLPGDSLAFEYNGVNFCLSVTGKKSSGEYSEYNRAEDYKLFLTGTKNGEKITQLLVEHESFDDAMVSIQFIGDIDGDGFPDLIIDTARHYNVSNPTLYLSNGAGENQLLQVVGWHLSVGC